MKAGLFGVDYREIRIGGEGHGGLSLLLVIVMDIGAAALLVAAQNQAAAAGEGNVQVLDRFHGHESTDGGALVVRRAAAIDAPVDDFGFKGFGDGPALPRGDHVQVGQDVQLGGPAAKVRGSHVVFIVPGGEAQFLRQLEGLGQGGGGTLPVGLAGEGVLPEAGDLAEADNGGDQLVLVLPEVAVQLLLVHILFDLSCWIRVSFEKSILWFSPYVNDWSKKMDFSAVRV